MSKQKYSIPSHLKITDGSKFSLSHFDPNEKLGYTHHTAKKRLRDCIEKLTVLQEKLAAHASQGILIVLQGMDTSGKDGAIRHAFSGLNPQGLHVVSFKTPAGPEAKRDDLWRIHLALPAYGEITIFNRSHYEDVLVTRVHPDIMRARNLNPDTPHFWQKRLTDLKNFEAYLSHQNIHIIKIFLNISKDEQKKRLLKRLDQPEKRWKFSSSDLAERSYWESYQSAYENAIQATSTEEAPWYVVPANHKWLARLITAEALLEKLEALHLSPPETKLSKELTHAKAQLLSQGKAKSQEKTNATKKAVSNS
ncbi:PPK2 family polyphosphate kinase [Swingsia samuiensis]|uniref:Polyphosphate kinase 2 family protein n=1 Tax=Swingsia samuiensis TaxID=1293412 RepID=A0A4Y6UKP7_9PROT|nr:PPK2 family polyphosphate kinase [Swingsia samuiensis]QDH17218.1 polyphosphate kinase 2 family protein [Swingsia samuiensis]